MPARGDGPTRAIDGFSGTSARVEASGWSAMSLVEWRPVA
jgi:hypothetical protein